MENRNVFLKHLLRLHLGLFVSSVVACSGDKGGTRPDDLADDDTGQADAASEIAGAGATPAGTAECVPTEDEEASGILAIGRSFDIAAVLDDLLRLLQISVANDGPALDLDRVAVAGWSGGARGPMVFMGAKLKPTASAPIFTNPKVRGKAAIFMSPAGPTSRRPSASRPQRHHPGVGLRRPIPDQDASRSRHSLPDETRGRQRPS